MSVREVSAAESRLGRLAEAVARHRVAATAAFLLVLPLLLPYQALAVNVLVFGLYAVGYNLLFGYRGLLSFGHAAFFGGGAYGCGIAVVHLGLPWVAAIAVGVALAGVLAMAIGALAARVRGIYFAMVTLALAGCVYYVFYQAAGLTGGENGLRGVDLAGANLFGLAIDFLDPTVKYFLTWAFVVAALWAFSRILASPFGAALESLRENEARARACGVNATLVTWFAFVLSGLFCGLAGALQALHLSVVPIDVLHYTTSGLPVLMTLLGGMGTFFGPFVGAAAFVVLEDVVTSITSAWQLVVGVIFVACVLFLPHGLWGTLVARMGR